jgi:hypothetical protein
MILAKAPFRAKVSKAIKKKQDYSTVIGKATGI